MPQLHLKCSDLLRLPGFMYAMSFFPARVQMWVRYPFHVIAQDGFWVSDI